MGVWRTGNHFSKMKTILIATLRTTGKDVVLAGTDVALGEQTMKLTELYNTGSAKYSHAGIFYLQTKRAVKLSEPVKTENS